MEEQRETRGSPDAQKNRGGIMYITEELLMKLTGCQSLALVRSLNLSSLTGDKRIKFIENLHGCRHLEILKLDHNMIDRMERLNTLTQLRELQLAHNNIQRIEGLELMSRLQHLNLSHNRIEHIPLWFGNKLQSLHTLHLQHNLITSLYEVSRLRSLSSLSELTVSGNPACSLQHSRLFLLYHLRTLDRLDDLLVTQEERGHAHQRFNAVTSFHIIQKDEPMSDDREMEQAMVTQRPQQEEANQALKTRRQARAPLEHLLHARSQLLKMTAAFHWLNELEKEWTFYKSDTKLPPLSSTGVQEADAVSDSLYIGKALHAITPIPQSSSPSFLQSQRSTDIHPDMQTPQPQLEYGMTDKSKASDQQLDHQEPEEALKQHTSLDSFLYKLSVLEQLKDEADEVQRRMEQQTEERRTTERETDELETQLLTLEPTDPQHAHVTSQLSSCRQLLERMSGKKSELEDRLDDMLSRIAVETQEITELEQQLTDGQILANEALQRDLEGIISGLQDYLRGLREKAHRAEQKVLSLQAENQNLQLHLVDAQRHCRHLEESARTSRQQEELSVLWTETQAQRERQAELEAELQQLREGLKWQITEAQVEKSSLQQVVQNLQDQLTQTRSQFHQTTTQYEDTKAHLDRTMLDSKELQTGSEELHEDQRSVDQQTRTSSEQLQEDHNHSKDQIARLQAQLAHSQNHITKLEAQVIRSQDRIVQLETQAIQDQDRKAQMETQAAQDHNRVAQLESQLSQDGDGELERLRLRLQTSQSRNTHIQQKLEERLEQSRMQLHDVQQERDALLQQLCSQSSGHQKSLGRLNRKLRQLSRSMCNSDQLTTEQLKSTMEQLRSVKNMVELLHTQTQQAPSLASQGTQDSGLGLPYLGSPERQQDRPPAPPRAGGRWVYVPDTAAEWRDCGGDGGSPAASAGPAWLFCGPPAVYSTPAGGAALHCNVPEHRHEVDRCVHEETDRLEKAKKKKLQMEIKQLRRTLRRHRGVMQVCDEVECVEKTLLKRQAELRQADRLLLEAQSCIDTTRDKASSAQREADVLQRTAEDGATCLLEAFRELQEEVEELLRSRQEEEEGLKEVEEALSHRHEELQRANSDRESAADRLATVLSDCQDSQRRLNSLVIQEEQQEQRIVQRTEELQTVVSRVEEVREEERRLHDRVMEMLDQQKTLLSEKRSTVTALRGDEQKLISVQSELHTHRAELKQLLQEVLVEQQTLEEVKTKHAHSLQQLQIKQDQLDRTLEELDLTKDELDGTKGELNGMTDKLEKITVELNRTKGELDVTKDELQGNKCELDKMKDKLVKTKAEVDRVKSELDGKRDVLEKTVDELESSKDELGRVKKQLEGTKSEFDGMKGELDKMLEDMGRKKEELAELQRDVSHRKKAKQRQTELQQEEEEELGRKRKEWSSLQEKCKHLEARRRHADRCLSVVEVELDKQREELKHLQLLKQEVQGDTAATQDQLNENSELLFLLSERVEERKKQLQTLEQELRVSRQQQRGKHLNEVVCGGMEIINAAGHLLEDRGCCLTQQELQLSQFTNAEEQLWEKEKDLLLKEEELNHKRKELQLKEEELKQQEKMLYLKWEEFNKTEEELDKKEEKLLTTEEENIRDKSIYLSTAGLRSAFSPEETWEVEMQREQLRQKDDRLKARLRCNLWNQQETLEVRRVETEDSLLGLKHRLDQLDSLLGHTDESSGGHYFRDPESHV